MTAQPGDILLGHGNEFLGIVKEAKTRYKVDVRFILEGAIEGASVVAGSSGTIISQTPETVYSVVTPSGTFSGIREVLDSNVKKVLPWSEHPLYVDQNDEQPYDGDLESYDDDDDDLPFDNGGAWPSGWVILDE